MTSNLRFIAHTAQRNPTELSTQSSRNRTAQRGLSGSGRTHKAENRPLEIPFQGKDCDVLDNPILHLLQAIVIFVQDSSSLLDIQAIFGDFGPRQFCHPLKVVPDDAVLGRCRRHLSQTIRLSGRLLDALFRHPRGIDFLPQHLDAFVPFLALTQFAANRLKLLTQHVLALRFAHFRLHLLLNLGLNLDRLPLFRKLFENPTETCRHIDRFEDPLLSGHIEFQVRSHQIGELGGIIEVGHQNL